MMGRISINQSDDWHVEHDRQDIRGWEVRHADGERVGRVRDLIADTDTSLVDTLVLDNGEEIPAADVEVGYDDKVVYLGRPTADKEVAESASYEGAGILDREAGEAAGFATYEPGFRQHYRSTYSEAERDYGHYHPAYRLGYDYGVDDRYSGREWNGIEDQVRRDYEQHHGEGTWSRVKEAARHAFEESRSASGRAKTNP